MPANRQFLLVRRPQGAPAAEDFALVETPVPAPPPGGIVVRNRFVSLDPAQRGCQLSILVHENDPRSLQRTLQSRGVVSDFREPNVIRVAPVPLYNTFHEVWRFARVLAGDTAT